MDLFLKNGFSVPFKAHIGICCHQHYLGYNLDQHIITKAAQVTFNCIKELKLRRLGRYVVVSGCGQTLTICGLTVIAHNCTDFKHWRGTPDARDVAIRPC